MDKWQSIETAPENELILIRCGDSGCYFCAMFESGQWCTMTDYTGEEWFTTLDHPEYFTHWIPLPQAPEK